MNLTLGKVSLDDHLGVSISATRSGGIVIPSACLGRSCCVEGLLEVCDDVVDEFCANRNTDEILLMSILCSGRKRKVRSYLGDSRSCFLCIV
jgi:hypothetical protein